MVCFLLHGHTVTNPQRGDFLNFNTHANTLKISREGHQMRFVIGFGVASIVDELHFDGEKSFFAALCLVTIFGGAEAKEIQRGYNFIELVVD